MLQLAETTRRRLIAPQLRPVPKPQERPPTAKSATTIRRNVVGGSVKQMSSLWNSDANGNKPIVLPIAGKPLEKYPSLPLPPSVPLSRRLALSRKTTSTYQPNGGPAKDRNNNPGLKGRRWCEGWSQGTLL